MSKNNKHRFLLEDYLILFPNKKELIDIVSKLLEENTIYNRREAAKYLMMAPSNILRWRERGWLKGKKTKSHPGCTFYTREDLDNAKNNAKYYIEKNNLNSSNPLLKLYKRWEKSENKQ